MASAGASIHRLKTDFCIPGFPKCSTSALARFLENSPACHLSKLPNSYESPYFMETIKTPKPNYVNGLMNGHKFAAYVYAPKAMRRIYEENPQTLFIIMVRPALPALLSWRRMHSKMAEAGAPGHFTTKDEETRQFYKNASVEDYFSTFADPRLNYADHILDFLKGSPDARFVVLSQTRLAEDARGVLTHIHDLLGVEAPESYLAELPESHTGAGDRAARSTQMKATIRDALKYKDDRLRAFLDTLADDQKLVSSSQIF